MKPFESFQNRLQKAGITVVIEIKYPFAYLRQINNKRVTEENYIDGYVIAIKTLNDNDYKFVLIRQLFNLIRKYRLLYF